MQTITTIANLCWNWLVYSSKDSTKFSQTVKGSTIFLVTSSLASHFGYDIGDITNSTIALVVVAGQFFGAVQAVIGAFNKLNRTRLGSNAVLKDRYLN